jgi:hypothetical protein
MYDRNEVMDDFIHKRGPFSQEMMENYVDPHDLSSLRYHQGAAKEILHLAEKEGYEREKRRLVNVVKWHNARVDSILDKYGRGTR